MAGKRKNSPVAALPRRRSPRLALLQDPADGQIEANDKQVQNDPTSQTQGSSPVSKASSKPQAKKSKAIIAKAQDGEEPSTHGKKKSTPKAKTPRKTAKQTKAAPKSMSESDMSCLPRSREEELKQDGIDSVMGIDEAGRGPLCGPVVAAAVVLPTDIDGITDSKKITKEEQREVIYERIMQSPNVRYAIAVMDAAKIDEINILQATMEGMRVCAHSIIHGKLEEYPLQKEPSVDVSGSYVVLGGTNSDSTAVSQLDGLEDATKVYALVDGNRTPKNMPCESEPMVKGDGREFAIAAASVLAKVTRDRLMHAYDVMYPEYDLKQNKGYPTAFHMGAVKKHGATSIHRRTFAPLKHMNLDQNGKIIETTTEEDKQKE